VIGLLLVLRPSPYPEPATTVMPVEISIEPEGVPSSPRPDEPSSNIARQMSADVSAMPLPSPIRPDAAAMAPSSNWSEGVNAGRVFDLPAEPAFKSRAPELDMLGAMLDCLAVERSSRGASREPLRAHPPCAWADLAFRTPLKRFQAGESEANESAFHGDDYRTFKTILPLFDESLFPYKVPQANRALKRGFMGLFR
jgi:hypothetical protein